MRNFPIFRALLAVVFVAGPLASPLRAGKAEEKATSGSVSKLAAAQRLPTLFIIGDSTVNTRTKGQLGWGDPLAEFFDKTRIKVENRARGGRSSRTYYTEGLWKQVLADMKPGDFVLMQFGHND